MNRWLRQHRYAFSVALSRLSGQPFSSLSNIFVIALTLAVPIISWAILASAQPLATQLPVNPEITLYLTTESDESAAGQLATTLREQYSDELASARVITRESAYDELKGNPIWADALSTLGSNPLPHTLILSLADSPEQAAIALRIAEQLKQQPGVERVQLDSDWVRRLEALLHFAQIALLLLSFSVVVIVVATVFNTVRLQALSQREEIAVARLVGATESFVRRPFLYQGALTGLIASGVAVALSLLALLPLNDALNRLAATYELQILLHMPDTVSLLLATFLIALVAALAARWSVTRSTRF
ncbi:ABC transporter permease [Paenalcaligenes niemegkensis]|uniref:cell division protein FtsX n=1 Tax=Paenalcaligenes niemegkensis TaxID=2895469 RepID=UPI001EE85683|nr:ABC transporter permease [Paenalcaligenes niemegkensis]MCQ9615495.1 ABC transporter permease [Paenalcaligenes niemegkensis]